MHVKRIKPEKHLHGSTSDPTNRTTYGRRKMHLDVLR